jgi:hypothetical protein
LDSAFKFSVQLSPADRVDITLEQRSHLAGPSAGTIFLVAKFKPTGTKKPKPAQSKRGFIPCLIVLAIVFVVISLLFYEVMKSG